jgi:hypothetical protein
MVWRYPVGQSLGAALLRIGDLDGAEKAFTEMTARQWRDAWTGDTSLLRLDKL